MIINLKTKELEILLLQANLNKRDLAKNLKVSPAYVSLLFNNQRKPSGHVRERLMKLFNVGFDDLFTITKE